MVKKRIGFTIIELLIVVVIIIILSGVGLALYKNVLQGARSAEAYSVLADMAAAEAAFKVDSPTNSYTTTWTDLDRFDAAPNSDNFTYELICSGSVVKAAAKANKGTTDYYIYVDGFGKLSLAAGGAFACP